ncbi:hypothetical protein KUV80_07760 [Fictibacillus nanhaiensis]|uniref:hypothetical protein n=1 Tax=Fictibacillus nanhaiensis TaxID=742169 RepID=UPI001C9801E6|nr:hypothetical protein [Fictibacillus nanhaiensis]MBY6036543.1 hypothetical protein [Fictibacillus nanhaiensis]
MKNENDKQNLNVEVSNAKKYRGDSVDAHKDVEDANQYLNEGEISQQNNNL